MKKLAILLAVILCIVFAGCNEGADTTFPISEEKAIEIVEEHWDIKSGDVDEKTGFVFSIMVSKEPTEEIPYYRIALRWLVNNSNFSTVDEVMVDAKTGEIIVPGN